jgi:hypothetical protein
MKEMVTKYLWILCISAVLLSLVSCGNMPAADRVIDQHERHKAESNVSNFDSMARALGCVFAPQSCKK